MDRGTGSPMRLAADPGRDYRGHRMGNRTTSLAKDAMRGLAGLWLVGLLCACSGDFDRPGSDAPGKIEPSFVSLNPCLDAILIEVAQPSQVLALSHYSRDPASSSIAPDIAARTPITGGTAEEVIALEPDIVLASSFISPDTRRALERAGLQVETFGSPARVNESVAQVRRIAQLAGAEAQGEALAAKMRPAPAPASAVDGDLAHHTNFAPTVMLWQPGQIVPGERTLISQLLREAGFVSHSERRGMAQADFVSLETVIADPPDLLLIAGDSRAQNHELLGQLDHVRVEPFPQDLLFCAGPTIPEVRKRLTEIRTDMGRDLRLGDGQR